MAESTHVGQARFIALGSAEAVAPADAALGTTGPGAAVATLPAEAVYAKLGTSPAGLDEREAARRRRIVGPNALQHVRGTPVFVRLLGNFTHLMAGLLWLGGGLALVADMPQLGIAIWLVVVINGVFSFWQEYKAERAMQALRRMLPQKARVMRGGTDRTIPAEDLVPGDVLLLAEGDHISADARVVEEAELQTDESMLTGESHSVRKVAEPSAAAQGVYPDRSNRVFAGTNVTGGVGQAVVFATAMTTEFGRIAHFTQSVGEEPSPLQRELVHVTRVISLLAVVVGATFFLACVTLVDLDLAQSFLFALGMIVAFVPEGLLPTVSLALAMGVQRMARRQALIKRLSAVETLGCTTVICTDKTGTLTRNEMTVTELTLGGRRLEVTGAGYAPAGQILERSAPIAAEPGDDVWELLLAGALCNDARLVPPDHEPSAWSALGDATDAALLTAAGKVGIDADGERERRPRRAELPFNAQRKRMTTVHEVAAGFVAYTKGSPRELIGRCARVVKEGREVPLDRAMRRRFEAQLDDDARHGLRVLGIGRRRLAAAPPAWTADAVERDLTLLGLVSMTDPPRPEVAEAVARCRRAGIRIIIITGDYGLTAESIARRIGVLGRGRPALLTGSDVEAMDEETLQSALADAVIVARASPEHKLRVVAALQRHGHVVAVTGDGVNDAPALKKADIGIAMGIAGNDVAKEAADMVLADDNFASIVNAIEEGRAVYANLRKFITYIFTSNTPEALPFLCFAFSGGRIPLALNVMPILAIDLGTDIVPALALGAEPAGPDVMHRPPRKRSEHLITPALLTRAYLRLGIVQSVLTMLAFYFLYWTSGFWGQWLDLPGEGVTYRQACAMALGAVVATQIGNLFAQRRGAGERLAWRLAGNRLIGAGIAVEVGVLLTIVYVPQLADVFAVAPPPAWCLAALVLLVPALPLSERGIRKVRERFVTRS